MSNQIVKLSRLIQKMPEDRLEEVIQIVETIIDENKMVEIPECPHCEAKKELVVKYGSKGGKQRYRCNSCGKYFSDSTKSAVEASRFGEAVWKQVIRDTLNGVSLDTTAEELSTTHVTAFNMRHKILSAIETAETVVPTTLNGVCEVDDTYVLESVKGSKIPEDYHREPRKHGAKATKRGISNEQISIMAGVVRDGQIYTKTVNRATPSKEDVAGIFSGRIAEDTLILCDGGKGFGGLTEFAQVSNVKKGDGGFYHINSVNGYHSFIKHRQNNVSHGIATKYQNRYNALYSLSYGCDIEERTEDIYNILIAQKGNFRRKISDLKTLAILDLGQLVNT